MELFACFWIAIDFTARLEELVLLQRLLGIQPHSTDVIAGYWVDDSLPFRDADLALPVQKAVICKSLVDPVQAVVEVADVDKTPCQAKSTA